MLIYSTTTITNFYLHPAVGSKGLPHLDPHLKIDLWKIVVLAWVSI